MTGEETTTRTPAKGAFVPLFELARGGLGRVLLVVRREGRFERLYALKRLHPHLEEDPVFRAMFVDEARHAGLIRHPNVVSVLDVGSDDEGPYLVMDFVAGLSLSKLIGSLEAGELLPLELCARIGIDVARGLDAAHELVTHDGERVELVHRDVSPQNILLGFDGVVRVADFGIAKALGADSHTATGYLKGKMGYLSPEQLRFEPIDRRADLFAFGVVLYELLSGARLYVAKDGVDPPNRILHEPPPDITEVRRDVDPRIVELLFDLLAKEREQRPRTAAEVADRLEACLSDVVTGDAPMRLGPFLQERFEAERSALDARTRDAIAATSADPGVRAVSAVSFSADAAPARSRAVRRRWRGLVLGAVAFLVGSLLATQLGEPESTPAPITTAGEEPQRRGEPQRRKDSIAGSSQAHASPAARPVAVRATAAPPTTDAGATKEVDDPRHAGRRERVRPTAGRRRSQATRRSSSRDDERRTDAKRERDRRDKQSRWWEW